jgi:dihydroxyacetone kinase
VDVAELADDDGRSGGRFVAKALDAIAGMLADAEDELGRIDAVAGDGDHGRGMVKGSSAARAAAAKASKDGAGQGSVLAAAGKEWAAKAGGTSGVLWVHCSTPWAPASATPASPTPPPWPQECATGTTR